MEESVPYVCLLEFAAGDVIRLLTACHHAFHPGCIDFWFVSHKTCPICRSNQEEAPDMAAMTAMGVVVASGSDEDIHVISIKGIGESAEGEEREGMGNTIAMEGGEVE
ncbi:RING-H2 finger protein ATL28-like [Dendrobium catenatum]|uniref:RING-H2 finger protein ATL28-like n=1 Tax=Dendrobium catenatum TaxID=906689 RepID=UPI0009F62190|nr:RING-H2 finger protein ATL28-like [Dendrobium catenatum]